MAEMYIVLYKLGKHGTYIAINIDFRGMNARNTVVIDHPCLISIYDNVYK